MSISGNLAIVGAYVGDAAYIYAFDGTTWNQQAKLTGEMGSDYFGRAVAISGNTALVGAPTDSTVGLNAGAVYVFTFDGTTWTQQAKLFASDPEQTAIFGISLSLLGNTALIGAQGDDGGQGSAYVFTFDGTSWSQQGKLTATDGNFGDYFGCSVSLAGNRALIGAYAPGLGEAAYVFSSNGTTWSQEAKLTGLDTRQDDSFGSAVSISGDVALVAAPDRGSGRGAAYIFGFDGATWTQQTKLTISGATPADSFGSSVVLSDRVALIGAQHFRDPGKVYEFALRRNTWTLRAQLLASDGMAGNYLGVSVALSGNTVLAGADDTFASNGTGNAYIFSLGH